MEAAALGAAMKRVKWSAPFRGEDVEQPVFDLIRLEKDGPVGRIVLNSPEKRNPLGYERMLQIDMAAKAMELDDDIRVIIIKGEGPSFCSGYDISHSGGAVPSRNTPPNGYIHPDRDPLWQSYDHEHLRVFFGLWDLQKPVIAQIQGHCLAGGTELAAFCDVRIVARTASIGWPVGRTWSPGNIQYMPWLVGMTKAKYYMLTNEPMDGDEAYRCGWASEVVDEANLEQRTEEVARQIALGPTDLMMLAKRSINRQFEIMGFRTGMLSSAEFLALAMARRSKAEGEEFARRAHEGGLSAAFEWRDRELGVNYRRPTTDTASKE